MATSAQISDDPVAVAGGGVPVAEVDDLSVVFRRRRLVGGSWALRAVSDVSFSIAHGETLGLVGESGSGKSTTGRAMLRLVDSESGSIKLNGVELSGLSQREIRPHRRNMQMVFQDPYSSLDPSMVVGESIAEPLRVHEGMSRRQAEGRVADLLVKVGLSGYHARRYPYEFSGGQRQRVAIARALALNPDLIVLDEAVSALDVSTQNQVINLVEDLRNEFDLSYLFIAHDLSVVRHVSHRVAVMYLGRIVEIGPAERLYQQPAHPYTKALLSAVPVPNPAGREDRHRILLPGDLPDPSNPPAGCLFHTRCPYVMDICAVERPEQTNVNGGGTVACHLQTSGPTLAGDSIADLEPEAVSVAAPSSPA